MNIDYRSLMNGRRQDPLARLARIGLRLAAIPYRVAVMARNRKYDRDASSIHHCDVPVISIGNITTGGTGKTPVVCFLAKVLRSQDIRVALISRGYGRGENDMNDEAMELYDRLPDVPHVQDADRVEAARIASDELAAEIILMDDGFQHRRLHRDLDIVLIDATCPFGYDRLLPAGLLREPLSGLKRADLVLLTRCDAVAEKTIGSIRSQLLTLHPDVPIAESIHRPGCLREYPATNHPIESLSGCNVAAVSAIGNPQAFEQTIRHCGATVVASKQLPDHDSYSPETVDSLRQWMRTLGDVDLILCTHKDLVKLQTDRLGGLPLRALLIDLHITKNEDALQTAIAAIIASHQACESN